jgi:hypothetical protein
MDLRTNDLSHYLIISVGNGSKLAIYTFLNFRSSIHLKELGSDANGSGMGAFMIFPEKGKPIKFAYRLTIKPF